ncbi:MAG: hypothetical protein R3284_00575 [Rubricoccaceae bacterium]|nr:hypothetical protein [Rubricoccaceae bacterium]
MPEQNQNSPIARSLLEVAIGFVGVLLILPALFQTLRTLFKLTFVKKLVGEMIFVGFTALLAHEGVLNLIFGEKGKLGAGLLKPKVDDD